jgi:glycosyltransferase involved in cell wall biosynthesis
MKVLVLTPHPTETSAGHRFRIGQWAPRLEAEGIGITCAPFASPALSRVLQKPGHELQKAGLFLADFVRQLTRVLRARRVDLIYLLREAALLGPAVLETLAARSGTPLVFDFDDAVFTPYVSPANGYWSYLKFPGKTAALCRLARHVMAGNDYLAGYARRYNHRVTVVPTTIDTDRYRPELRRSNGPLATIGWTGSHSTAQHLRTVVPALEELARRRPFRLVTIGIDRLEMDGVQVEARPWRAASEVQDLTDVDIGIMPLPDDDWSRGKCGLKALQFMALGIPAVLSPVGVNSAIVRHGENGLLADGASDWVEKLALLIDEPDMRERLGKAARRTVEERYSARAVAPRVAEIFRSAASR